MGSTTDTHSKSLSAYPDPMTILDAAEYTHTSKQAVGAMIKRGRIKATRVGRHFAISHADLEHALLNKYSRVDLRYAGKRVYDHAQGLISAIYARHMLASVLGRPVTMQHVYYCIRVGQLRAMRCGHVWVIKHGDAIAWIQSRLEAEGAGEGVKAGNGNGVR
jgi:excisionase family DNA binding protein